MPVDEGLDALTGHYLGQDWEIFGATADEAIVNFVRYHRKDVPDSIAGLEALLASSMTEPEFRDHWIFQLHGGYDPRDDGLTFREWFAHVLALLRAEANTSLSD